MTPPYLMIVLVSFSPIALSQLCNDSIVAATPDSRFSVNGQEVTDTETGLIWQKCLLTLTGSDCRTGSAQLLSWSAALQAAQTEAEETGKAWRLPNIKELDSIVEYKCLSPAINLTIFPNSNYASGPVWSGSPYALNSHTARYVSFDAGYLGNYDKGYGRYVRLVRTEQ